MTIPLVGLSLDGAFLYDQRNFETDLEGTTTRSIHQQSFQVPVNLRFGVGVEKLMNVFVFTGPQFGFNVGDKEQTLREDISEWKWKSSNLSWNFGFGATLVSHLQLSANYNVALGKTGEASLTNGIKNYDAKSNAWQVALAYYF